MRSEFDRENRKKDQFIFILICIPMAKQVILKIKNKTQNTKQPKEATMTKTTKSTLSTTFDNVGNIESIREVGKSIQALTASGEVSIRIQIGDDVIELTEPERDRFFEGKIHSLLMKLKKDGFGQ